MFVRKSGYKWSTVMAMCCFAAMLVGSALADSHNKEAAAKPAKAAATKGKAAKDKAATEAAPPAEAMKTDAAHDAMMAEMMKYAAPGPEHAWLAKGEGTWKATVKMWAAPGEPSVNEGTSENRMILGGRYLEQRFKGTFMGQPFEGYGLCGYDNMKKVYQSYWIDNTSTGMMLQSGNKDEASSMLTMTGETVGPDGKPWMAKSTTKVVDDKTTVFSMYNVVDGKDQLMMEITYSRM
jgi:uncharacterized protein DUF1579